MRFASRALLLTGLSVSLLANLLFIWVLWLLYLYLGVSVALATFVVVAIAQRIPGNPGTWRPRLAVRRATKLASTVCLATVPVAFASGLAIDQPVWAFPVTGQCVHAKLWLNVDAVRAEIDAANEPVCDPWPPGRWYLGTTATPTLCIAGDTAAIHAGGGHLNWGVVVARSSELPSQEERALWQLKEGAWCFVSG